MQKPETVSLCAGNIHLTASRNVSFQITSSLQPQALAYLKLKSFPLQKQPSFSMRSHPVGQNSFPGVYLMINYTNKLNKDPISNVDNIPHTREIFNENQHLGS